MRPTTGAVLAGLLLPAALGARVAAAAPAPECDNPGPKPQKFDSQPAADEYLQKAQAYLDCLKAFYDEQSKAAKEAAQAANAARAEMQRFAAEVKK